MSGDISEGTKFRFLQALAPDTRARDRSSADIEGLPIKQDVRLLSKVSLSLISLFIFPWNI